MKIKTHAGVLSRVHDAVGRSAVVKHTPTPSNPLGQSGFHTLADDIMNVIYAAADPDGTEDANLGLQYRALASFLQSLSEFETKDTQDYCSKCCNVGECKCPQN